MKNKNLEKIINIIKKHDPRFKHLDENQIIEDISIDDLSKVQVIMSIEREMKVTFDIEDFEKLKTIGDFLNYLEEKENYV